MNFNSNQSQNLDINQSDIVWSGKSPFIPYLIDSFLPMIPILLALFIFSRHKIIEMLNGGQLIDLNRENFFILDVFPLLMILYAIYLFFSYIVGYFFYNNIVTNKKIIFIRGTFGKKVTEIKYEDIEKVEIIDSNYKKVLGLDISSISIYLIKQQSDYMFHKLNKNDKQLFSIGNIKNGEEVYKYIQDRVNQLSTNNDFK